ncbi:MAG: hypothetical protein WCC95_18130 [Candidatus Sulfotelmatobacter sp.]
MSTAQEVSTTIGEWGGVVAAVISYAKWHSIGWMILHLLFGWCYVIYFVIKY